MFSWYKMYTHLNWKNRIDQMIPKLSRAIYAVTSTSNITNSGRLKFISIAHKVLSGYQQGQVVESWKKPNVSKTITVPSLKMLILLEISHRELYYT